MITKLNTKQEQAIQPFVKKWTDRILRTEQTDEEIKENVKNIYRIAGLQEPKEVWIMDSMLGVQYACNFLNQNIHENIHQKMKQNIFQNIKRNIYRNILQNIDQNIKQNIYRNIGQNIGQNIAQNIVQTIGQKILENIRQNIDQNIKQKILENIDQNIKQNIKRNIYRNILQNIDQNIDQNIKQNIKQKILENIYQNIYQNIDQNIKQNIKQKMKQNIFQNINPLDYFITSWNEASWLQWYVYQLFYFEIGLLKEDKYSKLLRGYINNVIDIWSVVYFDEISIVSRKPKIKQNQDQRLHSTNSPAVSFIDGYELFYINGISFEKELWEKITSKKITFKEVLDIADVDQRNQALMFVGDEERDKWLEYVKAEIIDTYEKQTINGNPVYYKLYKIPKNEIFSTDVYAMWYTCPSTNKQNFSRVPEFKTVAEAMAWKGSDDENIISPEDWKNCIPLLDES